MNVKIYELDYYTYNKYKDIVKGNKNIDFVTAQKKLSRNIALAKFIKHDEKLDQQFYVYGKMFIRTNHDAVITGIWNNRRPDPKWTINIKYKEKLDKYLGLVD